LHPVTLSTPQKRDTSGRRHYEEVTDSTAPVIDFRQSLHDVSSSAPPRTRSRPGCGTDALLRQHQCQLRFQNKKPPAFIAFQQTPTGGHSAALAQAGKGIGDPVIVATACKGCSLPKAESKTAVLLRAGKVAGTAVTAARARLALT
jgi:hypothetical protein